MPHDTNNKETAAQPGHGPQTSQTGGAAQQLNQAGGAAHQLGQAGGAAQQLNQAEGQEPQTGQADGTAPQPSQSNDAAQQQDQANEAPPQYQYYQSSYAGTAPRGARAHMLPTLLAAIAAVGVAALLLIMQPWRPRIDNTLSADSDATAQADKGTGMFGNLGGEAREGEGGDQGYEGPLGAIDILDESDLPAIGLDPTSGNPNASSAQQGVAGDGNTDGADGAQAGAAPIAMVAGIEITAPEFRYFLNYYKSSQLLNSGIAPGSADELGFWSNEVGDDGETMLDYAKRNTLAELVDLKMCVAIARERGIELDADDVANINTTLRSQADRFGGEDGLRAVLADEYGVTAEEYRKLLENYALRAKLLQEVRESTPASDEELQEYYDSHADELIMATVREIAFLSEGLDAKHPRTDEQTRAVAEDAMRRAQAGEDMAELAESLSEDIPAQADGGLATYSIADISYSLAATWAFDASPGDIGIIETAYGYCVIKLESRDAEGFLSVRPAIVDALKDEKQKEALAEWRRDPKYAPAINEEAYKAIE